MAASKAASMIGEGPSLGRGARSTAASGPPPDRGGARWLEHPIASATAVRQPTAHRIGRILRHNIAP